MKSIFISFSFVTVEQLCLVSANYNKCFPSLAYDIMTVHLWLIDQTGMTKYLEFIELFNAVHVILICL